MVGCGRTSATSRPSTMPSPPSTGQSGSRARRSSAFVHKEWRWVIPGATNPSLPISIVDSQMPAATSSEMQHSFKWQQVCARLLRVGLAAAFLSAVADRFGVWGQPGSRGVSWGDMAHFYDYTAEVNAFLPSTLIPAVAWLATIAETGL